MGCGALADTLAKGRFIQSALNRSPITWILVHSLFI